MKRSRLLYSLFIVMVYGCQQNSSDTGKNKEVPVVQNHASNFAMKYSDSLMQLYGEKAYSVLVDQHYKFPSSDKFEQVVKEVYHIDVKKSKYDNVFITDDNGPVPIAIKQQNFIYIFDPVSGPEAHVNDTLTFHLNNYLFHNNEASKKSLLNSINKHYLFELVEKYGYAKDVDLLKYVLNEKYKNEDRFKELGNIIFNKKPKGNLEIRTGILDFIVANTKPDDIILARNIQRYCIELTAGDNPNFFSEAEKAKIIAFAANSIDPIYQKYHGNQDQHWGTASIICYYMNNAGANKWSKAEATYTKEKYYNLPHLAEMISYAYEFDKIGPPD